MGGIILDSVPVAQQPSLSVEESIVESVVGSRPTSGDKLLHSIAITTD